MKLNLFAHAGADRPLIAILLLLIATFTLAFQDALMKLVATDTSIWQIQTLRSAGNLSISVILAALSGGMVLLKPKNPKGVYLRAAFLAITMFFFFSGAPFLSVAEMAAGLYTYPVFICLLAAPVLGEKIGPWRLASIVAGTAGALLVLSPWRQGFTQVQLLPLTAGFFFACNVLTLRKACREESTLALAFAAGIVFIILGLLGIMFLHLFPMSAETELAMPYVSVGWPQLTWFIAGFALIASVLNLTGNICLTRAYQTADASLLAPLDFSYLLFAALWGKIIFDQWPQTHTLYGMFLIISAGATISWREHLSAR